MDFLRRAEFTVAKGIPVIRLRPNSKAAMDNGWPELATTDPEILKKWDAESPESNCGAVAQAKLGGVWFWEIDNLDVVERLRKATNQELPNTFVVRSRPGRGHLYFKHTLASIAMGNISQSFVQGGDWSARVDSSYVVSANSVHPNSGELYLAMNSEPLSEAPEWLISWLLSQKTTEVKTNQPEIKRDANNMVPHGSVHGYLLREAGKLRNLGLEQPAIEIALMELAYKNCAQPLDDSRIITMSHSICKSFPPGQNTELLLTQKPNDTVKLLVEPEELPVFEEVPYPKFPDWALAGSSIYENFVKPICDENSRIPYFLWFPAMAILLNYLGTKVKIKYKDFHGSIYTVLIGKKGQTNKSSSVEDAMKYFSYAGMFAHAGRDTKIAEGRTLSWTVGSMEGLGMEAQRTNCKNILLNYDELSYLINKAGIETSSLVSNLLLMYESKTFQNLIKSKKETFMIEAGTYCASLVACTTNTKFAEQWGVLAGSDTGLDDRFTFVLQPKPLPERRLYKVVNVMQGAIKTRQLADKAVAQGVFEFDNMNDERLIALNNIDNRYAIRAEKWALGLAVDLGLSTIDEDCIERATAIVHYEIACKKFLKAYEATTKEGGIQQEVRRKLEQNTGLLPKRDLERKMHSSRYGTSLWGSAYKGLIVHGIIREEGTGTKGDPIVVRLLRASELGEEWED
jgi:hypothetical protein